MRALYFFNLIIIVAASLFTFDCLAATPLKVHVLDNLSTEESRFVMKALSKLGYAPTNSPLFTESDHAVVITKILAPNLETESIRLEILEKHKEDTLPKTVFELKSGEKSLEGVLKHAPDSEHVKNHKATPVAALR
ncbi:MAG: hypothetical protein EBX52_02860 [Proteobacteria bacterium]|nr:hypothetical protein [Pseudomonadota bacterium]